MRLNLRMLWQNADLAQALRIFFSKMLYMLEEGKNDPNMVAQADLSIIEVYEFMDTKCTEEVRSLILLLARVIEAGVSAHFLPPEAYGELLDRWFSPDEHLLQ